MKVSQIQQLQALGFNLDHSGMVMGLALGDDFVAVCHYESNGRYTQ